MVKINSYREIFACCVALFSLRCLVCDRRWLFRWALNHSESQVASVMRLVL